MIRILGRANSFNVRKVLWTCGELGLAFEREDWGRGYRPTADPAFRAINPIGLVPAVIDGDAVLRESNTIVRYLVSKYAPGSSMYPADLLERARAEQWMDWANYETSISLRGAFLGGMLNEPPWNHPWFVERGRAQIAREVGQLDEHLEGTGPFVTGATFTVGDIPVGLVVNRWFHLNIERPRYPAVERYYEALSTRPAYRTHVRNGLP
ncbi:MAG TPA: glutathione S-transferase family protein [Burkholderiales bacterium]|nr:glutathione S-transferase family protein [Burkholderiales bacterium]